MKTPPHRLLPTLCSLFFLAVPSSSQAQNNPAPTTQPNRLDQIRQVLSTFPSDRITFASNLPVEPVTVETLAAHDAAPKRTVRVVVDTPPGEPPPQGAITLRYQFTNGIGRRISPDGQNYPPLAFNAKVPLINGGNEIDMPTPIRLVPAGVYVRDQIPGYWLVWPQGRAQVIPEGADPHELRFQAIPAGLIHGHVRNADGTPAAQDTFSIFPIDSPRLTGRNGELATGLPLSRGAADRYVLTPVPINATYCVIAVGPQGATVSPQITVNNANPVVSLDVTLAKTSKSLAFRLLTPNGTPAPRETPLLQLLLPETSPVTVGSARTDEQGTATFARINPDIDGEYELFLPESRTVPQQHIRISRADLGTGRVLDLTMAEGLAIEGIIIDKSTGNPLPNRRIMLLPFPLVRGATAYSATTDAEGRFSNRKLPPGQYTIDFLDAYEEAAELIPAPNGQPPTVRLPPDYKKPVYTAGSTDLLHLKVTPKLANPNLPLP